MIQYVSPTNMDEIIEKTIKNFIDIDAISKEEEDTIRQALKSIAKKAEEKQKKEMIEIIKDIPCIEITHKDGSKSIAILENSLKTCGFIL